MKVKDNRTSLDSVELHLIRKYYSDVKGQSIEDDILDEVLRKLKFFTTFTKEVRMNVYKRSELKIAKKGQLIMT